MVRTPRRQWKPPKKSWTPKNFRHCCAGWTRPCHDEARALGDFLHGDEWHGLRAVVFAGCRVVHWRVSDRGQRRPGAAPVRLRAGHRRIAGLDVTPRPSRTRVARTQPVAFIVVVARRHRIAGDLFADAGGGVRIAGALLALCALVTLWCTANIYRSLKTIRAWRTRQVLPLYFAFALLSGGLWLWTWLALSPYAVIGLAFPLALLALAVIAAVIKTDYWRRIDAQPANTAGHATGLEKLGHV